MMNPIEASSRLELRKRTALGSPKSVYNLESPPYVPKVIQIFKKRHNCRNVMGPPKHILEYFFLFPSKTHLSLPIARCESNQSKHVVHTLWVTKRQSCPYPRSSCRIANRLRSNLSEAQQKDARSGVIKYISPLMYRSPHQFQ